MESLGISEKKCTKCGLVLPIDWFYKDRRTGNGIRSFCKNCEKEFQKAYRQANKEKISERDRAYRQANKEKISERDRAYRRANKEKISERDRAYGRANKEKISERDRAYGRANKEKINERMKASRQANKEKISERMKAYRQANREKIRAYRQANREKIRAYRQANREKRNEYHNKRKKTDICYAIKYRLRDRIRTAVKAQFTEKASKTKELLGCDYATFKRHFEKQFTAGMTWDLFMEGKIHIDHIVPCANFDLKDEQQQRACFHYKNLQPLWAADNLAKQDKILEPVQMVLGV